jgi:ankyrin repeat protein
MKKSGIVLKIIFFCAFLLHGSVGLRASGGRASLFELLQKVGPDGKKFLDAVRGASKADLDIQDGRRETILHKLVEKGVECFWGPNIIFTAAFYLTKGDPYIAAIGLVIEKGADLDIKNKAGRTPLHLAVRGRNERYVEVLVKNGADTGILDNSGKSPLHCAALPGYYTEEIFRLFLDNSEADFGLQDKWGKTTIDILGMEKEYSKIKGSVAVLAEKVGVDSCAAKDLLFFAICRGDSTIASKLIRRGVDINSKESKFGGTPLLEAIENKRTGVVVELLNFGADPNLENLFGTTPLSLAIEMGSCEIVEALLEKKADPNSSNWLGGKREKNMLMGQSKSRTETTFFRAVKKGNTEIVSLLLKYNANPNLYAIITGKRPSDYAETDEMKNLLKKHVASKSNPSKTKSDPSSTKPDFSKIKPDPSKTKPDSSTTKADNSKAEQNLSTDKTDSSMGKDKMWLSIIGVCAVAGIGAIACAIYYYNRWKTKKKVAALVQQLRRAYRKAELPKKYRNLKEKVLQGVDPAIVEKVEQKLRFAKLPKNSTTVTAG